MDVSRIFEAAEKASKIVNLEDRIRSKEEQIASVTCLKCGNCDHWMKTSCRPEKERGEFKSVSSPACEDFAISPSALMLRDMFTEHLEDIKRQLKEARE